MRKILILFIFLFGLVTIFQISKPKLASYLLTQELSSENKVKEIQSSQNQLIPDFLFSQEVIFNNQTITSFPFDSKQIAQVMQDTINNQIPTEKVLGVGDERWIEVNLSQQRLYGWEGNSLVHNYLVSTGRWAPTPAGDFRIWTKLISTKMSGGSKALGTYYYLPNVPCTMYFYKGYGLHGTYWHNNFGHPMSHGCVNMKTDEACALFNWASVGTRVNIHY